MNTLQKNNLDIKTFSKGFSIKNYHFEFRFRRDKQNSVKTFFVFIEKGYQKEQQEFISKIGYGLEHQTINNRNKITAHTRKQILKKTGYGE